WDNIIAVGPGLAFEKGLSNGDLAEVTVGERALRGPVWIAPGQAPQTIALYFGYGRRAGGGVAQGNGYDAYAIQPDRSTFLARGNIPRVAGQHAIATTQAHHRMDGFDFVREVTVKDPHTPLPKELHTLYPDWNADVSAAHAWGMVIDLDLCMGCN